MLHLETVAPKTLELLIYLQNLKSMKGNRLVGGTALALQYGHRISVDLDFFFYNTEPDFLAIIKDIKHQGYKLEIRKQSSSIIIAMIDNIKVDFVFYPYPWIDIAKTDSMVCMATDKEIAAMKLSAITNRGSKKDFIDLYYLLKNYTLEQMLAFYSNKYNDGSQFMVIKSLTYFDDADTEASPILTDKTIHWDTIKNKILNETIKIS